jgi:3-mercaptopyruvate sulfurtransferase SseA
MPLCGIEKKLTPLKKIRHHHDTIKHEARDMKRSVKIVKWTFVFLLVFFTTASAAFAGGTVQSRVTPQWVADNINSIKIIDLRYQDYPKGHIPGAVQMKWGDEVFAQEEDYLLPPNLPETKRLINKMGIVPEDHIVLYDGEAGLRHVMRIYWVLKYWNFPKVSIMVGGLALWEKENRPLTYEATIANHN